ANSVPGARLVVAEQSRHYIQFDQPDLVIEMIRDVVAASRGAGAKRRDVIDRPANFATEPCGVVERIVK
ncbi:MAG TPA: hypothetical protein VND68_08370, partial [Chloroflexia bacterium]|nr:hypothetical protein [Chloroflexia bacterium]